MTLQEAAADFLAQERIAVVGVSRHADEAANFVFRKLSDEGHVMFPVNALADEVEHTRCYHSLAEIPGGVAAVAVFTPPETAADIVRECAGLGITRVWLHRALGAGSVSADAVDAAREHHVTLIPGGCPAMHCASADVAHRCMRWVLNLAGRLPREVAKPAA